MRVLHILCTTDHKSWGTLGCLRRCRLDRASPFLPRRALDEKKNAGGGTSFSGSKSRPTAIKSSQRQRDPRTPQLMHGTSRCCQLLYPARSAGVVAILIFTASTCYIFPIPRLPLRQVQQRDDGGLSVVGRVLGHDVLHSGVVLVREVEESCLVVVRGVFVL